MGDTEGARPPEGSRAFRFPGYACCVTAGILDSIDGALRDYEVSADAMRWQPGGEREAPSPPDLAGVAAAVALDLTPFTAAMEDLGRMMSHLFGDALGRLAPLAAVMTEVAEAHAQWARRQERRRGGGRLAVDGHEYRRRQAARRRRR